MKIMNKELLKWLVLVLALVQIQPCMADPDPAQGIEPMITIPNDGSVMHTISGIGKVVGDNFDPKNVRVSLDGGKTWIVPDSVVLRPDGTFAWAKSTLAPPGKITVDTAILNPGTATLVRTPYVAALQVSQKPPEVAAAARAVETVKSSALSVETKAPTPNVEKKQPVTEKKGPSIEKQDSGKTTGAPAPLSERQIALPASPN